MTCNDCENLRKEINRLKAEITKQGLLVSLPDVELVSLYEYRRRSKLARQEAMKQAMQSAWLAAKYEPDSTKTFEEWYDCIEVEDEKQD